MGFERDPGRSMLAIPAPRANAAHPRAKQSRPVPEAPEVPPRHELPPLAHVRIRLPGFRADLHDARRRPVLRVPQRREGHDQARRAGRLSGRLRAGVRRAARGARRDARPVLQRQGGARAPRAVQALRVRPRAARGAASPGTHRTRRSAGDAPRAADDRAQVRRGLGGPLRGHHDLAARARLRGHRSARRDAAESIRSGDRIDLRRRRARERPRRPAPRPARGAADAAPAAARRGRVEGRLSRPRPQGLRSGQRPVPEAAAARHTRSPMLLPILALLALPASDDPRPVCHPGDHAPAGVLDLRCPMDSSWMVSLTSTYTRFDGLRVNSQRIDTGQALALGYQQVPESMDMSMTMLELMFAANESLTLSASLPWITNSMKMRTNLGQSFTMDSSGIGDTAVGADLVAWQLGEQRVSCGLSVGIPTGSITETGGMPGAPATRLEYPMQLGSGTWDISGRADWRTRSDPYTYGVGLAGTTRTGHNSEDYPLGGPFRATASGAQA